jgi:hypothetical protein
MDTRTIVFLLLAMGVAAVVSYLATPMVKTLAYKVGAIDVPKDNRRMHKVPIPRLGGLAIFLAFLLSVLIFAQIDRHDEGHSARLRDDRHPGRAGRHHGAQGAAQAARADRGGGRRRVPRLRHPVPVQPQRVQQHDLLESRLAVDPRSRSSGSSPSRTPSTSSTGSTASRSACRPSRRPP